MEGVCSYRKFHSSADGKDYVLRLNDGKKYKNAVLFQINAKTGEEVPVLSKIYGDSIYRNNILTGGMSDVAKVNGYKLYSELYDMAGRLGLEFNSTQNPSNKILKKIYIDDCGTKLNLLVRDGEIKTISKGYCCLEPGTFERISPMAKKWVKKFLQMTFKAL